MKKLFLSLVAAVVAATATYAQGSLLATLSHDGNISAFYGANALKSAVEAAEAGDVITLSSGQFNAANIDKPITLRGAGMSLSTDSVNAHEATTLLNDFTINVTDTLAGRIVMEGLYMKGGITYTGHIKNAQFLKCRFKNFVAGTSAKMTNSSFIHCRIYKGVTFKDNSNAFFINSIVCGPKSTYSTSNIELDNCFVKFDNRSSSSSEYYGRFASEVINTYYKNCIIQDVGSAVAIPSSCTVYNCVGLSNPYLFDNQSSANSTNKYVNSISSVFKNYNATGTDTYIQDIYNFELTDEAAAKYLGTDGTQVGIYGGNLVYDENPTIPQITKCNVAAKSTADGKLSVDIEVKAADY